MSALEKSIPTMASKICPAAYVTPARLAEFSGIFAGVNDVSAMVTEQAIESTGSDVLIIDLQAGGALVLLDELARSAPNTKVLVMGDALPSQAVRSMLALKASDLVGSNAAADAIVRATGRLMDLAPEGPTRRNQCWVVSGAVGGAGATTIAIEMACATAMRDPENNVCLVDMNLADGMVPAYLEAQARLDLYGLAEAPDRLDATMLDAYSWPHDSGVTIIAAPRNPDVHDVVTADMVLHLLDTVCSGFSHVIVDMPRERRSWSKPLLAGVDEVLVVSEFTVPSLQAAADMSREIDDLRIDATPARLVLNRMSDSKMEFSVSRASKAINRDIEAVVRSDWKSARAAVNLGMPVAKVKPKSVLVKDVRTVLKKLDPALTETGKKRMWR
jgi:pilus assembly protein CpaE